MIKKCLLSVALLLWSLPALACSTDQLGAEGNHSFDDSPIATAALNEHFIVEVNAHRCDNGLAAVTYNPALEMASKYHSDWMNDTKVFAHDSTVSGMTKPWNRAKHFGYVYRQIAENLALYGRYDFRDQSFYIEGPCLFTRASGEEILPITYEALAKQVGLGWMNSPGHRANILLDGITEAAVAVAVDYDAEHCGRIYITMLYGAPRN